MRTLLFFKWIFVDFPTGFASIKLLIWECAVPENIYTPTPPTEWIGISRGLVVVGGESLGKNPFRGEVMDIFWNYTLQKLMQ